VKTTLQLIVAVTLALVAQSLLGRGAIGAHLYVDLPLVAVVYVALARGRVAGLLAGTVAGLAQDATTGGVLGVGGMAKSLAGFLSGLVGTQFIVTQTVPRLLVFIGASLLSSIVFVGLYLLLGLRGVEGTWLATLLQALGNGLVGVFVFEVIDFLPGARERWRIHRDYRRRVRFR
jgi:rod shape-determining protein MreD